jgi:hypothetical protein
MANYRVSTNINNSKTTQDKTKKNVSAKAFRT